MNDQEDRFCPRRCSNTRSVVDSYYDDVVDLSLHPKVHERNGDRSRKGWYFDFIPEGKRMNESEKHKKGNLGNDSQDEVEPVI